MLVIRLARTGKKKQAYFRIIVSDKRRAVGAKFVDAVGNYDPHSKKTTLDSEKLTKYIEKGAQPSNTVAKLLAKADFKLPKWVKITQKVKKKKEKSKAEPKPQTKPAEEGATTEPKEEAGKPVEGPAREVSKEKPKEEKSEASKDEPKSSTSEDSAVDEPTDKKIDENNKSEENDPDKVEPEVEKE